MNVQKPLLPDELDTLSVALDAAERVLAVIADPRHTCETLAGAIGRDPVMAARILRVANSSVFCGKGGLHDLSRAVVRLGDSVIHNCVVGTHRQAQKPTDLRHQRWMRALRRHSYAVAIGAQRAAEQFNLEDPELVFTCGLLHDFGQLAMAELDVARFEDACCGEGNGGFLSREAACFGLDHTLIGQRLLERWGIPPAVCEVVALHHEPIDDSVSPMMCCVVLADVMAQRLGYGLDFQVGQTRRDQDAAAVLGITPAEVDALSGQVVEDMRCFDRNDDPACAQHERPLPEAQRRVWWVGQASAMGCALMKHLGMQVQLQGLEPGGFENALLEAEPMDWLVIDERQAESAIASARQCHLIVLQADGERVKPRRYDPDQRVAYLSPRFTLHDLRWAQEMIQ